MTNAPSKRPYIFRAIRDWIIDCGWTPYILVNCNYPGVEVPTNFIDDGRIVLNVSAAATIDYLETNEMLEFGTKFGGLPYLIKVPMNAIVGVYSKETSGGIVFDSEYNSSFTERNERKTALETIADPRHNPPAPPKKGKPHLTLVKSDDNS